MVDKAEIVARLHEIAQLLELHGGNKFKTRAFVRGARALEASREPVGKLVDEERLEELPGIGAALARQIEDLYRTGRSKLLDSLREGLPAGVLELSQVGIGLHAVKALHDELGISTIEDLRAAAESGRLREAKGFGPKREQKVLAAITRYEREGTKVPLADGLLLAEDLEREIEGFPGVESVHLAGTLGRGAELSDEIDLVVATEEPAGAIAAAAEMPRVGTLETKTDSRCRMRLADGTRVEIVSVPPAALPVALVRASSAPGHFAKLEARAHARGMRLDGDRLIGKSGRAVPLADEAALYEALGLSFVPQALRDDLGEIEEAARGATWDDLVTADDVRGFVHCHTDWSDGRHTIEQMARAAKERGAEFITITDHSSAAHYANGLDVERLRRQWDAIEEAEEKIGIRILKGTEADILADGAIDWPDRILDRLDVVVASIHARFRQDEEKMTARVLRAMRHPTFKIWGHPLGRLVTSRPPIPLRVEEVLDALAAAHGAIEISGDPSRLDLEPRWVRAARARGIPFVLSVDAHSMRELENVRYAAMLARRAGVRRGEVLNARGAAAFAKAVRPKRSKPPRRQRAARAARAT